MFLFAQTWAAFLVQIHLSHGTSAQHRLTAPENVQLELQMTVQWLGRSLSRRVPSCLLFQPPFKMLVNTAFTFSWEGSLQVVCLPPVLILGKCSCPHRQAPIMYLQYWNHHLQYKASLKFVPCFHLFQSFMYCIVFTLVLCTRVNPTSFSFFVFVSLPVVKVLSRESPQPSSHQRQDSTFELFGLYSMDCWLICEFYSLYVIFLPSKPVGPKSLS